MDIPKTFSHSQPSREFWRWASENAPRHRVLRVGGLPLRNRNSVKKGSVAVFKRLLDHLVSKGWPEYVILWTHDGEMQVFGSYLLQGVRNSIRRSRIG